MIRVTKKNGEVELYDKNKIIRSLKNSQADEKTIEIILSRLNKKLYDKIETREIFRFVFNELKKLELLVGTKYNLKQGIINMSLGGGFLFEKFMERVFRKLGYKTQINQILRGKYTEHEIDIIICKNNQKIMVECKHFSKPELGISIQTALYVYARFLDLRKSFDKAILVTNTKFSTQVIEYSRGVGIELIGWRYPYNYSLEQIIEKNKIYPITILPLPKSKINRLLRQGILTLEELENSLEIDSKTKELIKKLIKK